ncbi:MAG TPA: ABC transporter ATP-binding protein [Gammaproteobacteria bacterium]|nr:ABC transporter ATP-binding protein [Gammaproteobacteria bacterium]
MLSVENLAVRFEARRGPVEAVRGVSFEVAPGEIVGIVGETGSGKSVTARAIVGLLPGYARVAGRAMLDGRDLAGLDAQSLSALRGKDIGMIFQNPSSHLDPLRRIGWQIAAPMRRHLGLSEAEAWTRAVDLLETVGIGVPEQRARAYPHEFSGGMKQRAMIAAAIGCGPRLLIADEPTTALDVTVQARILDLLRDLNRTRNLSIILISHDLGVIAETCSRIIVMRDGEIVEQGPTDRVRTAPRHAYTRLLINSQPALRAQQRASDPSVRSAATTRPLLEVRDLSVEFALPRRFTDRIKGVAATFKALDGVSLTVMPGETVGIVGESGSGKSTLARAIVRLIAPSGGTVAFEGDDVHRLSGENLHKFRQAVQMVFQNPYDSLNPRMTAGEMVAEPLIRHKLVPPRDVAEQVSRLLDMVEMPRSLADRKPGQLSGGQCQRVGLARALAMTPRFLIADEITSALDVTTQAQILDLPARLQHERGLGMLYISHDLSVVGSICQRVYVFRAGRIVETGPAAKVMTRPRESYTIQLVSSVPRIAAAAAAP